MINECVERDPYLNFMHADLLHEIQWVTVFGESRRVLCCIRLDSHSCLEERIAASMRNLPYFLGGSLGLPLRQHFTSSVALTTVWPSIAFALKHVTNNYNTCSSGYKGPRIVHAPSAVRHLQTSSAATIEPQRPRYHARSAGVSLLGFAASALFSGATLYAAAEAPKKVTSHSYRMFARVCKA
jgi:hypothetical protein